MNGCKTDRSSPAAEDGVVRFRGRWVGKCAAFLVAVLALVALLSYVVMRLWNALIPDLFHGPMLGFWQAAGQRGVVQAPVWRAAWPPRPLARSTTAGGARCGGRSGVISGPSMTPQGARAAARQVQASLVRWRRLGCGRWEQTLMTFEVEQRRVLTVRRPETGVGEWLAAMVRGLDALEFLERSQELAAGAVSSHSDSTAGRISPESAWGCVFTPPGAH